MQGGRAISTGCLRTVNDSKRRVELLTCGLKHERGAVRGRKSAAERSPSLVHPY